MKNDRNDNGYDQHCPAILQISFNNMVNSTPEDQTKNYFVLNYYAIIIQDHVHIILGKSNLQRMYSSCSVCDIFDWICN